MIHLKFLTTSGCSRCDQARQVIEKVRPDFPDLKSVIFPFPT